MERATNAADRRPDAPPILTDDDLVRRFTLAPEEEAWAYTGNQAVGDRYRRHSARSGKHPSIPHRNVHTKNLAIQ
jgi:hypothetical protein